MLAACVAAVMPAATVAEVPVVIERPTSYRQFGLSLAGAADGDALRGASARARGGRGHNKTGRAARKALERIGSS